jgi:hypothetical protein
MTARQKVAFLFPIWQPADLHSWALWVPGEGFRGRDQFGEEPQKDTLTEISKNSSLSNRDSPISQIWLQKWANEDPFAELNPNI